MSHADYLQLYGYFTLCSVRITHTKDLWIFMGKVNGALDLNTKQGSNVTTKGKFHNLKAKAVSFSCQSHNYLYRGLKHTTNIKGRHYPTRMENICFSCLWSNILDEYIKFNITCIMNVASLWNRIHSEYISYVISEWDIKQASTGQYNL